MLVSHITCKYTHPTKLMHIFKDMLLGHTHVYTNTAFILLQGA